MSHKYFEDQFDDEEVLLVFKKHPVVMRKALIAASFMVLLGVIPSFIKPEYLYFFGGLGIGFGLGGLIFFYSWIGWHFSNYVVTTQRFIQYTQKGLFGRGMVDIALNQIQMVSYEVKGIQETLLGFGTVTIQTFVGELVIHEVHHPEKIQKKISHYLRELGFLQQSNNINIQGEQL